MHIEELTHSFLELDESLDISLFEVEHSTVEVPYPRFCALGVTLTDDPLPPPRSSPLCDSDCACT